MSVTPASVWVEKEVLKWCEFCDRLSLTRSGTSGSDIRVDCSSWTHHDRKLLSDGEWHSHSSEHESWFSTWHHPWCSPVLQGVCKVGAMASDSRIDTVICWCMSRTFVVLWSRRWWFPSENCYWRWNLGSLPPARNQESEQGMVLSLLTKTEGILHITICREGYADSFGMNKVSFWSTTCPGGTLSLVSRLQISGILFYLQSNLNDVDFWVQVSCCNMSMLGPILPEDLHFKCVPHPTYFPDLAPSDYHFFGPLKEAMWRKTIRSNEEVQQTVYEWLCTQTKDVSLKDSMHFISTGELVLNAMETVEKCSVMCCFCLISYEKEIYKMFMWLTLNESYRVCWYVFDQSPYKILHAKLCGSLVIIKLNVKCNEINALHTGFLDRWMKLVSHYIWGTYV